MGRHILLLLTGLAVVGCSGASDPSDHQSEWRQVLEQKRAASAEATPLARQNYADALSGFVRKHPGHGRAREVYNRIQLEFANQLVALGRYQQAIGFYRSVLDHDARNAEARHGLRVAIDRLAVTHEKLLTIDVGMSQQDVARLLGRPVPGWSVTNDRPAATIEAWYYRTSAGGVAAIYFREGQVFAAEEKSQARINL